jgi:hypothetical protein
MALIAAGLFLLSGTWDEGWSFFLLVLGILATVMTIVGCIGIVKMRLLVNSQGIEVSGLMGKNRRLEWGKINELAWVYLRDLEVRAGDEKLLIPGNRFELKALEGVIRAGKVYAPHAKVPQT